MEGSCMMAGFLQSKHSESPRWKLQAFYKLISECHSHCIVLVRQVTKVS